LVVLTLSLVEIIVLSFCVYLGALHLNSLCVGGLYTTQELFLISSASSAVPQLNPLQLAAAAPRLRPLVVTHTHSTKVTWTSVI